MAGAGEDEVHDAMSSPPVLETVTANGLRMRVALAGAGPLVILCHGWPEGWRSWRHQIAALAAAGYRVAVPDMRGYGGAESPAAVEDYSILHLTGDVVGLVEALGEAQAVIVGHDWGAIVAWHAALLRPDMFRAVAGMSVPWSPPGDRSLPDVLRRMGLERFYILYFQEEGRAERELDVDPEDALVRIYHSASGDSAGGGFAMVPEEGLLAAAPRPGRQPDWLPQDVLEEMAADFRTSGFRGGLNWYRNMDRNRDLLRPWRDRPILQPSLFVAGTRDAVIRFPGAASAIEAFGRTLPGLRGTVMVEGAGHWVQQERPDEVNAALLAFLDGL
jgi:pimeloyl-ACP methyl ester carboxylesterase